MSITAGDVADGEGSVSDAACLDLAGDFNLDFKACLSNGDRLIWESDCNPSSDGANASCGVYQLEVSGVSGFDCADTYNGTFPMTSLNPPNECATYCLYATKRHSTADDVLDGYAGCGCVPLGDVPLIVPVAGGYMLPGALWWFFPTDAESCIDFFGNHSQVLYNNVGAPHYSTPQVIPGAATGDVITFNRDESVPYCGSWPETITATLIAGGAAGSGPLPTDSIHSKWHLEYIIAEEAWVLRSFNRLQYPVYYLHDETPCEGETKVLTLLTHSGSEANGCGTAPESITLTRECAPERPARDRKRNKITGQLKHGCGCDCQDEVDDLRTTAKCEGTGTTGCETYDETGITCKYPKSADCCDYCPEDTAPCAYEALFDCDIEHDGHKIAAKVVTLRHECYFSDTPCDWVAVGPSLNPEDGGLGAQPTCATCADSCLSGCSWDAWQVAECPGEAVDCAGVAYLAAVASRDGKCLQLTWGANTSGHDDPPGYSLGATIDTLTTANGLDFTSASGWTASGNPQNPAPNDVNGCGVLVLFTPNTTDWGNWSLANLNPFAGWRAGHSDGFEHSGSSSPWMEDVITIEANLYAPNTGTITILAEWIDCP